MPSLKPWVDRPAGWAGTEILMFTGKQNRDRAEAVNAPGRVETTADRLGFFAEKCFPSKGNRSRFPP